MGKNLMDELNREMADESIYGGYTGFPMISTELDAFDYLNAQGSINKNNERVIEKGVDAGKVIYIIGKSGSGKSTFAIQMGYNIVKKYENGLMFVFDFEQSNDPERIKMITGISNSQFDTKIKIKRIGISTDAVYRNIMGIYKTKMEDKNDYLVDNPDGIIDESTGKLVKVLPPTVVLIDSLALMMPEEKLGGDELSGGMDAAKAAKANTALFKSVAQPCQEANIILIVINHIMQKISTSVMPTQAQTMYLSTDETLPGGGAAIYLANTLIRITTGSKLDETKLYQIKGFEAKVKLVKSRTAEAGKETLMIFNQMSGFDNDLSNLEFLKANGLLKGGGLGYYIDGLDDHKFRLSNFKEKLKSDEILRDYFNKKCKEVYTASVKFSDKLVINNGES